jgi:hypothetical protein
MGKLGRDSIHATTPQKSLATALTVDLVGARAK